MCTPSLLMKIDVLKHDHLSITTEMRVLNHSFHLLLIGRHICRNEVVFMTHSTADNHRVSRGSSYAKETRAKMYYVFFSNFRSGEYKIVTMAFVISIFIFSLTTNEGRNSFRDVQANKNASPTLLLLVLSCVSLCVIIQCILPPQLLRPQ